MPAMRTRSPLRPRPATHPTRAVLALALAAAATACGPRVEPRITPMPPEEALPTRPVLPAEAPSFHYGEGESAYLLQTRSTIRVTGDTTAGEDTLTTTIRVHYTLDPDGAVVRQLTGTIDSVAVRSGGHIPAPLDSAPLPVAFDGVLQGGRVTLAPIPVMPPATPMAPTPVEPVQPGECSPAAALVASARVLFPSFPLPLGDGARWTDPVTTTSCRGGVRLTTSAVHHYTVEGAASYAGLPSRRVDRVSELTLSGEGRQARERVTTSGSGTERTVFHLDPAAGRILYGTSETTLDLTFTAGRLVQHVSQHSRQDIRLAPVP
jgi:hypothetical protein